MGKTPPKRVLDLALNNLMVRPWGMWGNPLLPSLPDPLCLSLLAPDRALFMVWLELNCVLTRNWIVWNRTVLILSMCKLKSVLMLNWIVLNRSLYVWKIDLALNNLQWFMCHKNQSKPNQTKMIQSLRKFKLIFKKKGWSKHTYAFIKKTMQS